MAEYLYNGYIHVCGSVLENWKNNGRHCFFLNLQNGLNEIINYVMFIQFLLHIYIRDKILSFLSVVQKHSYFLSKMS